MSQSAFLNHAGAVLRGIPASLWVNRMLIRRLVSREIAARYRGSIFGLAWALVSPVALLTVYTFVFTVVFQARWQADVGGRSDFVLYLFVGLIVFQFFNECVMRAPVLLLENVALIKKVVFPLESLTWVAIGTAGFGAAMNLAVLLVAYFVLAGIPPLTWLLFPIVVVPLVLMTAGVVWFLAATGIYLRDLGQIVGVVMPMLLFSSAVFFPLSAIPQPFREWLRFNPLVQLIEMSRDVLLLGTLPNAWIWLAITGVAALTAGLGFAWFRATRRGFADIV